MAASNPPETLNTGLTDQQVLNAFQRALHDYTDAQIDGFVQSLTTRIEQLEARVTELEGGSA